MQLFPFVSAFYAFESPLFYSHCNHEGDVTIIPFIMGTHQGDPLGEALFALTHFKALHFIANHFPSCTNFPKLTMKKYHQPTKNLMHPNKIFEAHYARILSCFSPRVNAWLTIQPIFPS